MTDRPAVPSTPTRIAIALAGVFCCAAAQAQTPAVPADETSPVPLRPDDRLRRPVKSDDVPLFLRARQASRSPTEGVKAEGEVELRGREQTVEADKVRYNEATTEIQGEGNVRIRLGRDRVSGPSVVYRRDTETGFMPKPEYELGPRDTATDSPIGTAKGHGQAERLEFRGPDRYHFDRATYTACEAPSNDWYMKVSELDLDKRRNVGEAHHATVYFFDVPLLYTPWLDFPLTNERKSGFLAPTYGSSGRRGFELSVPYYLNLAPNYDATVTPRLMTKRGLQLNTQFRYLNPTYSGEATYEVLPNDRAAGRTRTGMTWRHFQKLDHWVQGLSGSINMNKVSDDAYFADLADRIAATSVTTLPREGGLNYNLPLLGFSGGWSLRVQRFQTLQDPSAPIQEPYERVPQLTASYKRYDWGGFDASMFGEYSRFEHRTQTTGERFVAYPTFAYPLRTSAFFLTPKFGLHASHYQIDRRSDSKYTNTTRVLPVTSVDAGMVLERETPIFGKTFLQTLEPRLFYVHVPYRRQDQIPLFDSALADFNFAQLFAENQYVGQDRFNDANQVTAAVTSRLIEPETGAERLRVAVGQRYYFEDQRVTLTEDPRRARSSDLLFAASGRITPHWQLDAGWQYNPNQGRNERINVAARYQPEFGKVLNMGYRYNRSLLDPQKGLTEIKQVDLSAQWPIAGNWSGVARWNYSLLDKKVVDAIVGMEYNAGCWVFRIVGQRFQTSTDTASNSFYFQLELNGLTRLGPNPLESLRRNIPGYSKLNEPPQRDPNLPQADWYEPPN